MCAQISSEIGNFDKMPVFVAEAADMGYDVLPPDINRSSTRFTPERKESDQKDLATCIRFGLAGIKGVGFGAAESIVQDRHANGPYKSLNDFLTRLDDCVNKKALESLVRSGALDCFGLHRAALMEEIPRVLNRVASDRRDRASGQQSFFNLLMDASGGTSSSEELSKADIARLNEEIPPLPRLEQLLSEKELLGIYLSGHPINRYNNIVSCFRRFHQLATELGELEKNLESIRSQFSEIPPQAPDPMQYEAGERDPHYQIAKEKAEQEGLAQRKLRYSMSANVAFCAL